METTFIRGFSNTFVPNKKVEVAGLQFIEGEELERTWKTARRQRLKQQEDKIWSKFVEEQDVLKSVCNEDPYQFLERLPDAQLKELMETEIKNIKEGLISDVSKEQKCGAGDSPRRENQHMITFSEVQQDDMFQIFDDDKDYESAEENLNDTPESPCTVRERSEESPRVRAEPEGFAPRHEPASVSAGKPEENVATVIESSIYCAKVKDLRIKINNELKEMITSIENLNIACIDPWQLHKLCRCAAEYSVRFQRIHLYQLQRQINDIKRHNALALPFAKHTQFQSQMVRIVTLHQSTFASLQVFHKSFEQTACLRECADQLRALCETVAASSAACSQVPVPADFVAAKELYNDGIVATCNKLSDTVKDYIHRVIEYVAAADISHAKRAKRSANKKKKKAMLSWSHKASKSSKNDTCLSMYSLETLQLNKNKKGSKSVVSRLYEKAEESARTKKVKTDKDTPKSHRKSPRSRRPLMRDPNSGQERKRRQQPENDIHTMVEAVEPPSSQISRDTSPPTGRRASPSPRNQPSPSPSPPPHATLGRPAKRAIKMSPRMPQFKRTSPYIKPHMHTHETSTMYTPDQISPVSKIQIQTAVKKEKEEEDENQITESALKLNLSSKESNESSPSTARPAPAAGGGGGGARGGSVRSDVTPRTAAGARSNHSPRQTQDSEKGCEVTKLLKQLCNVDNGSRNERQVGAKNAQLVSINSSTSPRPQTTTPQLLKILEETIQKKIPKHIHVKPKVKETDRLRLAFNIPQKIADNLFQYRTKFVQHMLASSMYANSSVGKPWEVVGRVSELIIDEFIMNCAEELQMSPLITELYTSETQ